MENHKEFFENLNENIKEAKSRKTLKILEKQGKKFITHMPSSTDSHIKKESKRELNLSMKLIKKQYKILK